MGTKLRKTLVKILYTPASRCQYGLSHNIAWANVCYSVNKHCKAEGREAALVTRWSDFKTIRLLNFNDLPQVVMNVALRGSWGRNSRSQRRFLSVQTDQSNVLMTWTGSEMSIRSANMAIFETVAEMMIWTKKLAMKGKNRECQTGLFFTRQLTVYLPLRTLGNDSVHQLTRAWHLGDGTLTFYIFFYFLICMGWPFPVPHLNCTPIHITILLNASRLIGDSDVRKWFDWMNHGYQITI